MEGLSVGRIVHFKNPRFDNGACRAAMIVRVWSTSGTVNLTVFPDWSNDSKDGTGQGVRWETSVQHESQLSEESLATANSWHWPEHV